MVLGGGHGISMPLATCQLLVYHFHRYHDGAVRINGMIISVPQSYEYFDRMQDRVISSSAHSHISGKS